MAKKLSDHPVFMVKALVHSCEDGEHKPVMIGENGDVYELMSGTPEEVQSFVEEKSEKYGVGIYYTDSCRFVPRIKDRIGNNRVELVPPKDS